MRYTFGDCRLDTTRRELLRGGAHVHLSPKAYELLRLLVEHRPRVMSKQELMDMLWPGTFVVEANLHVLIGELRAGFGDKSTRDSAIKTHHGVGYSFAADVRERRPLRSTGDRRVVLAIGGREVALDDGANQVGRDRDCDVYLSDASVSRRHARIRVARSTVIVEDLESKNGTLVNGKRIGEPMPLVNGDTVTFGSVAATIEIRRMEDPSTMAL